MRDKKNIAKAVILVALAAAILAWPVAEGFIVPADSNDTEPRTVSIPKGAGTSSIADLLEKEGLISSETAFKIYVKLTGKDGMLKYGKYEMAPSDSLRHIVRKLEKGIQKGIKLTVPEGYTAKQIAARLEALDITTYDEFMELVERPTEELKEIIPFEIPGSLEGYLFPDTYEFVADTDAFDVVSGMLRNFADKVGGEIASRLKVDLLPGQVVILASIVEKETLLQSELPIVAGVFMNRLRKSMALQSCSTVQYVLPQPKPVLSKEDTLIDSPYNTYLIQGLPPGAISNPGKSAIEAVLEPAAHNYLFFVSNGDGTHSFSRTYAEHLKAKLSK
ncbi:MAG TPA: endolytic transglycosylase MltG [Bacillota bacterium]|nr:MAG: putative aminodeoxychorismate lyase [Firmicutes bacterium ADurb.Bin153]HNV34429.1 endolytic transglycosylase MltG [Bacillota bacterium]